MNKDLKQYESDVNIDEIWAAIEPEVDIINAEREKKKKFRLPLWWGLSGILLMVFVTGYFIYNNTSTPEVNNISTETNIAIDHSPSPVKSNADEAEKQLSPASAFDNNDLTDNQSNPNDNEQVTPLVNHLKNKTITNSAASNPANSTTKKSADDADLLVQSSYLTGAENANTNVPAPLDETAVIPSGTTLSPTENQMTSNLTLDEEILFLPKTRLPLLTTESELPPLDFTLSNKPPAFGSSNSDFPNIFLEFQAGISKPNRSLTLSEDNRTDSRDTLLGLRNRFESTLEGLHTNLFVGANLESGFSIKTGVSYTQFTEVYSNNSTISESITVEGIQKIIINLNGDTIPMTGPVDAIRTTTFTKKFYNTYRMVDIPVVLGYQYNNNDDWTTDFELGLFTNILLKTKGKVPESLTTDMNLETTKIYKSRVGYSFHLGLGVSRRLSEKLSLRLNPNMRYYPKNMLLNSYGLEQRYVFFGVNLGLKMQL